MLPRLIENFHNRIIIWVGVYRHWLDGFAVLAHASLSGSDDYAVRVIESGAFFTSLSACGWYRTGQRTVAETLVIRGH